jgi:PAS domain S-box-containing protein
MTALLWLHDARLKPLAFSPLPAWLWAEDAKHVLWANPTGAAIFGAATPAILARRLFDGGQPTAAQVERLAQTLPADGIARLERLRGFGAGIGRALTCACSRLRLQDGTSAILVASTERAGPDLSLTERATRLLAGSNLPIALFAEDGALVHATEAARNHLQNATSMASLGADALVATASGRSQHTCNGAPIDIEHVGNPSEPIFMVRFDAREVAGAPPPVQAQPAHNGLPVAAALPPQGRRPEAIAPPAVAPLGRRHPLRFVWQIDADGRYTVESDEFIALTGPRTAALLGQTWSAIASALGLDLDGQVERAIATRDTWSGLSVVWPVNGGGDRITVELSGLPVYDRERAFRGYRGFGVCRDIGRLNAFAQAVPTAVPAATEVTAPAGKLSPPEPVAESTPPPGEADAPSLSPVERRAFYELSRRLTGRIAEADTAVPHEDGTGEADPEASSTDPRQPDETRLAIAPDARPFLDRLPIGVLVYRLNDLLYANRAFFDWAGHDTLDALTQAGGLDSMLIKSGIAIDGAESTPFIITSPRHPEVSAGARLLQVPWDGEAAFALLTMPVSTDTMAKADAAIEQARAQADELSAILDTATDGVIVLDRAARILSSNRSAQALFGYDARKLEGESFSDLFTPDSVGAAIDTFDRLQGTGVASLIHAGREIGGREKNGGLIPLFMTMGRLGETGEKFCAVFRDITQWKKTEEDLIAARHEAERASAAKSDFLARVSHEIRTPLNAIIGFSEVMMEERFGPVGNDRYRQYLRDIHASGGHLISLVNDLLDLSKIEAGKLELVFTNLSINDLTQQCVAIMQTEASRERIIIRTSLSPKLPQIIADARSVRQIVLNLLSNSIKFTIAGGQVIVSTATTDSGDVALRVRDTGVGMSENDIATALEPFRQVATATRARSGGTGLGLPLTKALAEANHATFQIKSTPNEGTLVEITFPAVRVVAAAP